MRTLVLAATLLVSCGAPPPVALTPAPSPTLEPGVVSVAALLDLSGPNAAIGTEQRDALSAWTAHPPPGAPAVKVRTVDVAGSTAALYLALRRAAVEEPVDAVIVGVPVAYDEPLGAAIELAARPVLFTEPIEPDLAARVGGHWTFALAPSLAVLARMEVDDATRRDTFAPSVVLVDSDARVDPMAVALAAEVARRGRDPIRQVALGADGAVPALVRSNLSLLRSVHCLARLAACASLARDAAAASAPTLVYLPYRTAVSQVAREQDLAARAVFPWPRSMVPLPAEVAGVHAAVASDALSLLAAAARQAGDPPGLRSAIERITMPLIATTYSFSSQTHSGVDPDDIAYERWTGANVGFAIDPRYGTGIPTPTPSPTPSATPSASASP